MTAETSGSEEKQGAEVKRLYRSTRQRMIAGVCGGIAEYFKIDPTLVRITWAVLTIFGAPGMVLVYVLAAIIVPKNPSPPETGNTGQAEKSEFRPTQVAGIVILIVGLILMLGQFGVSWWSLRVPWRLMWGLFLVAVGMVLVLSVQKAGGAVEEPEGCRARRIVRVRTRRMVAGVCGGLARYFGLDPSLVRLAWALGTIASGGAGILAYIIMWIVLPEESAGEPV